MPELADIAIVGGGLAGSAAAIAVARSGLNVVHVAPKAGPDARTSALMMPSVEILTRFGLLHDPSDIGTPLRQIRIIDATDRLLRAPETVFDAGETGQAAFGWNFPNEALLDVFERARAGLGNLEVRQDVLKSLARTEDGFMLQLHGGEELSARLVIGADGKRSKVRDFSAIGIKEFSHKSSALVCDLELERSIGETSIEFHYDNGPFTLVPAGGHRANLVWIDHPETLADARNQLAQGLTDLLCSKAQHLFGKVSVNSKPAIFPLSSLYTARAGRDGILLIGEAAHAFPPIGAQGLNLGLRDIADLVASLDAAAPHASDWALGVSTDYARRRRLDLVQTGGMVDTLFISLVTGFLPAQGARAAGLWALRSLPFLRRKAFAFGMGAR